MLRQRLQMPMGIFMVLEGEHSLRQIWDMWKCPKKCEELASGRSRTLTKYGKLKRASSARIIS